ncbi:lysoplasmalogenase family protein [Flavobacterium sp. H122]|uniref:lysoplasmalogenase family protein n=1 Tax=Flavobacterium sp. H122 TaxID=2529860 RepID=UPI0010AAC08F|nr:lysoplasmalogenase family protein [Flavobacterium sp. H122]
MIKNTPIYFYIAASIMSVLAMVIENEWLLLLFKPMIIPALLIYYYGSEKKYLSIVLLGVLLIYFISDAFTLVDLNGMEVYTMVLDFIPYLLLVKVVLEDSLKIGYDKASLVMSGIGYVGLMLVMYYMVSSLNPETSEYAIAVVVYGVILAVYVCASLYNYLAIGYDFTMYIMIGACFGLIADVLYIIANMIFYVKALTYIEFVFQIISYFYIVAYFIKRDLNALEHQELYVK